MTDDEIAAALATLADATRHLLFADMLLALERLAEHHRAEARAIVELVFLRSLAGPRWCPAEARAAMLEPYLEISKIIERRCARGGVAPGGFMSDLTQRAQQAFMLRATDLLNGPWPGGRA